MPLLAYGFLVSDPRTHLYVAYPGWAVVAGWGAAWLWQVGQDQRRLGLLRPILAGAGGAAALLVAGYQAAIFLPTESALLALRAQWEDSAGEAPHGGLPEPRSYFGYPRRVGWKAAGWLIDTGRLPGDFRSAGEDFSVPSSVHLSNAPLVLRRPRALHGVSPGRERRALWTIGWPPSTR